MKVTIDRQPSSITGKYWLLLPFLVNTYQLGAGPISPMDSYISPAIPVSNDKAF